MNFEDLQCHNRSFRVIKKTGKGRDKIVETRSGIICNLGDLEESDWIDKMETLIKESNEWDLQEHLREYVGALPWCNPQSKNYDHNVRLDALILHSYRIFDDELWVNFINFNQKYRPDALKDLECVTVISKCCQKPFLVTKKKFEKALQMDSKRLLPCSLCGRLSEFTEISNTENIE